MCMCARLTQQPDEIVWRWTADGVYTANYAKEVWHLVFNWAHLDPSSLLPDCDDIQTWWASVIQQHNSKKQRRSVAVILMVSAWNIWNERNRRVFNNKFQQPVQVFGMIKAELLLRVVGCGRPELSST
ncbi:hypothetical protein PVAP13_5NG012572 [Panicum virgatum]|uniref:Uncharacterized protein n=1 Tax=Panicum virgatum TaxID=38727 RepID=A0A8T0SB91_PANVG|nr:hypothetical protein PVAP13_5NG012572 [Panicum virgatum]